MSKFFNQIHGILESNGESYESKYPEIKEKNVFSVSTLAHSSASQVYWKLKGQKGQFPYESHIGKAFFLGRAVHEFIQNRMKDCVSEYPLEYVGAGYKLVGHIDNISFRDSTVLEYKTTKLHKFTPKKTNALICDECGIQAMNHNDRNFNSRLPEYILQAGVYAYIMSKQTGKKWNASIFVINGTLTEYELTQEDIENSWKVINERAKETYEKLRAMGKIQI
jgi:hypothetical protein